MEVSSHRPSPTKEILKTILIFFLLFLLIGIGSYWIWKKYQEKSITPISYQKQPTVVEKKILIDECKTTSFARNKYKLKKLKKSELKAKSQSTTKKIFPKPACGLQGFEKYPFNSTPETILPIAKENCGSVDLILQKPIGNTGFTDDPSFIKCNHFRGTRDQIIFRFDVRRNLHGIYVSKRVSSTKTIETEFKKDIERALNFMKNNYKDYYLQLFNEKKSISDVDSFLAFYKKYLNQKTQISMWASFYPTNDYSNIDFLINIQGTPFKALPGYRIVYSCIDKATEHLDGVHIPLD